MPRPRHTTEDVTGIQRKYEDESASSNKTAPSMANQTIKVICAGACKIGID
ncbi:hypothetical protein D3C71_2098420 [compost metagenome]